MVCAWNRCWTVKTCHQEALIKHQFSGLSKPIHPKTETCSQNFGASLMIIKSFDLILRWWLFTITKTGTLDWNILLLFLKASGFVLLLLDLHWPWRYMLSKLQPCHKFQLYEAHDMQFLSRFVNLVKFVLFLGYNIVAFYYLAVQVSVYTSHSQVLTRCDEIKH